MQYLFNMRRIVQPDGAVRFTSFIQPVSASLGKSREFESEDDFERVRGDIFPTEPTTEADIKDIGYIQRDARELTDGQASSLGWDPAIGKDADRVV
jgi:hypothetical protein